MAISWRVAKLHVPGDYQVLKGLGNHLARKTQKKCYVHWCLLYSNESFVILREMNSVLVIAQFSYYENRGWESETLLTRIVIQTVEHRHYIN